MKLVNKISLWFIGIFILITPITMYISYNGIKRELDKAEIERMQDVNDRVAQQLTLGQKPDAYTQGHPIAITRIASLPAGKMDIVNQSYINSNLKRRECKMFVNSYCKIGNDNYKISSYNFVTKSNQILSGMLGALIWKLTLVIISMSIAARFLSKRLLASFRETMKVIHTFNLKQKEKVQLPETSIKEFKELNSFVRKMTNKAMEDYASVKEFSENASHELQTPLAIIRSKLELLSETNINASQAHLIGDMHNAIDKLSRINRSLALLTKLDNHEFETNDDVKFCRVTKDALEVYDDWICLKNIEVSTQFDNNVALRIHATLAEMLVSNLLSNAIRHNVEDGQMKVELSQRKLCISNTGPAPEIPIEELFNRFKKSNQCDDSIGLGLAIVKQICEVNKFAIDYHYQNGWHFVTVYFDKNDKEITDKISMQQELQLV